MIKILLNPLILTMILCSCGVIKKSPKTDFTDGFYVQKNDSKKHIVYVDIEEGALRILLSKMQDTKRIIDTTAISHIYQKEMADNYAKQISFNKHSFDIDFLTIPLKYRSSQKSVPRQLNTNLNGAVYFGYRTDNFNVKYIANPLKKSDRIINHYGLSFGVFTGLGNTAMTPTTNNNNINIEYDGIIWSKGIAGFVAINNFTVGISAGFDNLLDTNRKYWVYETKPWLGLAFGLNLN